MHARILHLFQALSSIQDPERAKSFFIYFQLTLVGFSLFVVWRLNSKRSESGFKLREADRPRPKLSARALRNRPDPLAHAKMARRDPETVLLLEGIRTDVPPHQLLGVSPNASVDEIQRAYRILIRRYHPDKVGAPGSREWKDAQRIAESINLAKDFLLKKHKT